MGVHDIFRDYLEATASNVMSATKWVPPATLPEPTDLELACLLSDEHIGKISKAVFKEHALWTAAGTAGGSMTGGKSENADVDGCDTASSDSESDSSSSTSDSDSGSNT